MGIPVNTIFVTAVCDLVNTQNRTIYKGSLNESFQKEHGGRGREHTNWIKAWQEVVLDLEAYVAEYHPYGLIWQKG